jgi:hypothetical protein
METVEKALAPQTPLARARRIKTKADAAHPVEWCSVCYDDQRRLVILRVGWTEVAVCSGCLVEARRRVAEQLGPRVRLP